MNRILILVFAVCLLSSRCYWPDSTRGMEHNMAREEKRRIKRGDHFVEEFSLVQKIMEYNRVEGERYGFTGSLSQAYKWMDSLQKLAPDSDLIYFMKYDNAAVRVYAFWGLAIHHYDSIEKIIDQHLCDTASFEYQAGCITSRQRVNSFCLNLLDSTLEIDRKSMKFSNAEKMKYERKMITTCGVY